ncbi:hypothetical protein [Capnocytophaga canimorsus]|uniref:hypothetical protein n=1 Tax=Capnocytophaga canimorsus TaxID=28188 RepID=UPI0005898833|nr:hypothetical protein [Capnocytophaga canimorsus]CEN49070.1 conserved hypothetical protein [Capnocytophaga canimorsus]VEJ19071.1 Uncharacterised protein [Capnocytophaga canimorsus]
MELNKKIIVHIPSNDRKVVEELVNKFKKSYDININIEYEEDRGGVNFFIISSLEFTSDIIFEMGYHYSSHIRRLREKGEIDW